MSSHNSETPPEENFIHFPTSPAKVMGTRGLNHSPPHSLFWISVYINAEQRDGFHGKQCLQQSRRDAFGQGSREHVILLKAHARGTLNPVALRRQTIHAH